MNLTDISQRLCNKFTIISQQFLNKFTTKRNENNHQKKKKKKKKNHPKSKQFQILSTIYHIPAIIYWQQRSIATMFSGDQLFLKGIVQNGHTAASAPPATWCQSTTQSLGESSHLGDCVHVQLFPDGLVENAWGLQHWSQTEYGEITDQLETSRMMDRSIRQI